MTILFVTLKSWPSGNGRALLLSLLSVIGVLMVSIGPHPSDPLVFSSMLLSFVLRFLVLPDDSFVVYSETN
jgi:Mn2+/Fe2+ NRAMP family transporter